MTTAITFEEFKNRSLKAEGTLYWVSALKNKHLIFLGTKFILYIMGKIEQETDLQNWDRETSEKVFPLVKNLHVKLNEGLPSLLGLEFPFISKKDKARLKHYSEFLEDVVESMEIGLNMEVASEIEAAAKEIHPPAEMPPWREVIEQV